MRFAQTVVDFFARAFLKCNDAQTIFSNATNAEDLCLLDRAITYTVSWRG
jgi:hypothetical protein